jgi:alpha-1,3-rhamnosyltransferase
MDTFVSSQPATRSLPLVSVIIPVYNRDDYIEEALDSVLQERYPNLELVVIDDGSTDNSKAVIEAWAERHQQKLPVRFVSRPNKGFVPTLNELILLSRGEYVVFFGSDDCLMDNGIAARYEYLQQNPHKLMVVGDCCVIDSDTRITHESAYVGVGKANKADMLSDDGLKKHTLLNGYYPGATLMARKEAYERYGLYDERYSAEDWVYYVRLVAHKHLGFLNQRVAGYRVHDSNMCASRTQLKIAYEQLDLMPKLWSEYQGIYKLYLLQRMAIQLLYIPYLTAKFALLDRAEQSPWMQQLLNGLLGLKSALLQLPGLRSARSAS